MNEMTIFTGRSNPGLAQRVSEYLGLPLGKMIVEDFPDGETRCEIEQDVRGRDVYVVQSTCPPVNQNLMELLIMIESFKRASAERISAVIPYFGYARQDRKDRGRVPITAKLVANLLTRAGADRVLTIDLHAAQIQGFFDIQVDHLMASPVITEHFRSLPFSSDEIMVVSPDEGSIKRALGFAKALECPVAIVDKRRSSGTEVKSANLIGGPIDGKVAYLFDDMVSTAGSICGAARLLKDAGAREIHIGCTHGVFCGNAMKNLREAPIDGIVTTDTIPITDDHKLDCTTVLTVAPLLGEAVRRIHCNESISQLFRVHRSWNQ